HQLRQLVEVEAAQEPAEAGDAGVAGRGDLHAVRVLPHRPELEDGEGPAALPDPGLPEDPRAGARQPHQRVDDRHRDGEQRQSRQRAGDVEDPPAARGRDAVGRFDGTGDELLGHGQSFFLTCWNQASRAAVVAMKETEVATAAPSAPYAGIRKAPSATTTSRPMPCPVDAAPGRPTPYR